MKNKKMVDGVVLANLPSWIQKILEAEKKAHLAFFGREFDLSLFVQTLKRYGKEKIKWWRSMLFEPHFFPNVSLGRNDSYFGWKTKLENWYYHQAEKNQILRLINDQLQPIQPMLEGIVVLIDTRLKPSYKEDGKQMFENDEFIGDIIADLRQKGKIEDYNPRFSRFNVLSYEWEKPIKSVIAYLMGLNSNQLRLETAPEANVIPQIYTRMPRKNDGQTNTWVWYEEFFSGRGNRLHGGGSDEGGLASVSGHWFNDYWNDVRAFRFLAVL